jgi:hypothetical protein
VTDKTLRRVELAHRYADLGDVRLHYDGSLGLPANFREHLLHELGWTGRAGSSALG